LAASKYTPDVPMKLKIKKLHPDALLPAYAHPGDAGMDVYALETVIIKPQERTSVSTGIAMEIPHGCVGLVWDKSGLSRNHGLKMLGGVIDAGYRGEVLISVINLSAEPYTVEKGHKIGQMIIHEIPQIEIEEATELSGSARGQGRFGSTGK